MSLLPQTSKELQSVKQMFENILQTLKEPNETQSSSNITNEEINEWATTSLSKEIDININTLNYLKTLLANIIQIRNAKNGGRSIKRKRKTFKKHKTRRHRR